MHSVEIKLQVHPRQIDLVNKLIEGCDGLAVVTTVDPCQGILLVQTSESLQQETLAVLQGLPVSIKIL